MIVGSSLCVEIGDRTLLRDASFVVGSGEKVGLVGRNGTGKSSFISVIVGEQSPQVRSTGNVAVRGTFGYLPQVPTPRGLGLDPNGFSHVLSGRGLDVLDDALNQARKQMAKDPTSENIELFSDLEEQYRENGGYEAESVMARLADGLGLPQDLLLEDIEGLSGGQRRRVDLIRILFQAPDTMILDEPTNHLDVPAKRWLMEELESFPGAILVVSHDLDLLDRAIAKVLHLADGHLREFKGTYSSYRVQLAADTEQRERAAQLEGREIKRLSTLADSMRGSTNRRARIAKSLDKRVERLEGQRTEVFARERKSTFRLPVPERSGEVPFTVRHLAVRYGPVEVSARRRLLRQPGGPDRGHRAQRRGEVEPAALPGGGAGAVGGRDGPGRPRHRRLLRPGARAGGPDGDRPGQRGRHRAQVRGGAAGAARFLRAALQGGRPDARLPLGRGAGQAGPGHAGRRPGQRAHPRRAHQQSRPGLHRRGGQDAVRWPGTVVAVSHDRNFVRALAPTHALSLPSEVYDYWRDEYLEEVVNR